jgi:MFS family permease
MADSESAPVRRLGALEPLRERTFRTIWSASLLANFGQLTLGVGAAWEMTRLTSSAGMVALVQSAMMLPLMLVSVPAGAIADMFDRRKIAIAGLCFAMICAIALTMLAMAGLTTPWVILAFCSLIGGGVALYGPAWQASVREQVSPEILPAAVALGAVSYNLARSFGPALGGLIVAMAGAKAAFGVNAILYAPLLLAFFFWNRVQLPGRFSPERLDRAIVSGARYAIHSPPIRIVVIRSFAFGVSGSAMGALTPLIARDLLHGNASTYGLLLGSMGVGAVVGALMISWIRERLKAEPAVQFCAVLTGAMTVATGLSHNIALTCLAMVGMGAAWMALVSLLNVGVQLSAPRWVTARALAWFQAGLTGGMALGAWMWGYLAGEWLGIGGALVASGIAIVAMLLIGLVLPMPGVSEAETEMVDIGNDPEVGLAITHRSGPIIIEVDYWVDPAEARNFYDVALKLQSVRKRNGGFDWSIARDLEVPELWTERFHCPTWGDYLRQRNRMTQSDVDLQAKADSFHATGMTGKRVRRRLERPIGSVRWRAETPDPRDMPISIYAP